MSDTTNLLRQIIYANGRDIDELLMEAEAHLKSLEEAAAPRGYSGGWELEDAIKEHAFSLELAYYIWRLLKPTDFVYDIGAGPGFYTQFLKQRGMNVAALDANRHDNLSLVFPITYIDISQHLAMVGRADVVLCLEVGEHIEPEFESNVINNICNLARNKIIMSWAIPGQGGFGHVNCQPNDYIIEQMEWLGWAYNEAESAHLRQHCSACSWFENTLMVFDRK